MRKKVAFVSHPFGGEAHNLDMAAKWISYTATKLEMIPFDTWVAWCRVLDESYRELGIEMNKRTIERCDVFVMFGGRISDGMKLELEHAKLMGLEIMDLTHLDWWNL